ncbi:T9SS type A sorting domain-containing protein [Mariniflexile litorale]|uniref:T9SS type A sorting domain-containing protein n=1 Tax=Mariniflexile litorale TaxID=3045158 RepID=A0AAU7EE07_9FLAO|nr:T9SS type A sorting domain-containing protein [Mariniflexile sp. KMM 9835]MDQ8212065.1 T9SS type A sorting domain-containing protein [Mariniflexile sp. KMM 9835]
MTPQNPSKIILTILCLYFVAFTQAQTASKLIPEKSNVIKTELPDVMGSAGLNNTAKEIDMMGEIIDNKGAAIIEKGFVYTTSENLPTILDSKIVVENTDEVFSDKLTGILTNTIYYIRSYATTTSGTSYGSFSRIDTSTQSNIDVSLKTKIKTYPNPSTSYISLSGLMDTKNYIIYNMAGKELARGSISYNNKIDVRFLTNGLYLLKLDDFEIIRFIKE